MQAGAHAQLTPGITYTYVRMYEMHTACYFEFAPECSRHKSIRSDTAARDQTDKMIRNDLAITIAASSSFEIEAIL